MSRAKSKVLSSLEVLKRLQVTMAKILKAQKVTYPFSAVFSDDTDQGHRSRRAYMIYNNFWIVKKKRGIWVFGLGLPGGESYLRPGIELEIILVWIDTGGKKLPILSSMLVLSDHSSHFAHTLLVSHKGELVQPHDCVFDFASWGKESFAEGKDFLRNSRPLGEFSSAFELVVPEGTKFNEAFVDSLAGEIIRQMNDSSE